MMLHVTGISFTYQSILVLAGNAVAKKLKSVLLAREITTRLAGAALIGFAVKLAFSNRY
jgi:threonine/homoserine/homoserine lactone efflux protein